MMAGGCGSTCPVPGAFYSYDPSVAANAVLVAVFAVLSAVVLLLGVHFRTLVFSATLTTGLLLSAVGFVGRILLPGSRQSQEYFVLSLIGTILGPVCIVASIFLLLPHILSIYGDHASPVRPVYIGLLLCSLEAVAAILQVIGVVSIAYILPGMGRTGGTSLAAGGLGVQLLVLVVFSGIHFWFTLTISTRTTSRLDSTHSIIYRSAQFKRFLLVTEVSAVLLLAYTAYRMVEMAEGVTSELFQGQAVFMVMNGAVPLVSAALITAIHPGAAFGSAWRPTSALPVRRRRSAPVLLDVQQPRPVAFDAHHRYDPDIRKQISPTSQRHLRHSNPPSVQAGSPGLPPNPKPINKGASPMPSPTDTAATSDQQGVPRSERFSGTKSQKMVEKDVLW